MPNWKTIACAVDFSETSRAAMEAAADLARGIGAELLLMHVFETPDAPVDMPPAPSLLEANRAELSRKLETWKAEAARLSGGRVVAEVVPGPAASEIVRVARERAVDLIVTGTHGRRGLRHMVLGSVAEAVVRMAHCPVLVVRRTP